MVQCRIVCRALERLDLHWTLQWNAGSCLLRPSFSYAHIYFFMKYRWMGGWFRPVLLLFCHSVFFFFSGGSTSDSSPSTNWEKRPFIFYSGGPSVRILPLQEKSLLTLFGIVFSALALFPRSLSNKRILLKWRCLTVREELCWHCHFTYMKYRKKGLTLSENFRYTYRKLCMRRFSGRIKGRSIKRGALGRVFWWCSL